MMFICLSFTRSILLRFLESRISLFLCSASFSLQHNFLSNQRALGEPSLNRGSRSETDIRTIFSIIARWLYFYKCAKRVSICLCRRYDVYVLHYHEIVFYFGDRLPCNLHQIWSKNIYSEIKLLKILWWKTIGQTFPLMQFNKQAINNFTNNILKSSLRITVNWYYLKNLTLHSCKQA